MNEYFQVFTDGGARGNPGPSGIGVVIEKCEAGVCRVVLEKYQYIGETTNNQAEYQALILSLQELIDIKPSNKIIFNLDSRLVVEQVKGVYKMKNPGLKPLLERVHQLKSELTECKFEFVHIPRERNMRADKLVNQAIDEGITAKGE